MATKATATTNTTDEDGDFVIASPVSGVVCSALIAPNGTTHYVPDWSHRFAAWKLGFSSVENALDAGFLYIATADSLTDEVLGTTTIVPTEIIVKRATKAQENALVDMYLVAADSTSTRCVAFVKGFRAFSAEMGWGE